jgi:hypothetical protein
MTEKKEVLKRKRSFVASENNVSKKRIRNPNLVSTTIIFHQEFRQELAEFITKYEYKSMQALVSEALNYFMAEKDKLANNVAKNNG